MAVVARKLWLYMQEFFDRWGDFNHPSQLVKMASESLVDFKNDFVGTREDRENGQIATAQPWKTPTCRIVKQEDEDRHNCWKA